MGGTATTRRGGAVGAAVGAGWDGTLGALVGRATDTGVALEAGDGSAFDVARGTGGWAAAAVVGAIVGDGCSARPVVVV